MKILVTGASGFIGSNLVSLLSEKGYSVRCFVRKSSKIDLISGYKNVEIFYGDMKNESSLFEATKDIAVVIHLAASTSEKASAKSESHEVNVQGAKHLVKACQKNKVNRLIVVSSQSTKRKRQGNYGLTKKLADEVFKNSGLDWTIFKPSLVYGPGSKGLFTKILKLIKSLPVIFIIGSGKYKLQPTYVNDLAVALVSIIDNKKTIEKTYDLAGKDQVQFKELIKQINQELQMEKKLVHVPFWLCYLGVKFLSLLTKNPPITIDNLLGLIQETEIDLNPAITDFDYSPISLQQGIKQMLWDLSFYPDKKRIGIIGLGKMGLLHASIVNYLPNTQIVALFDVSSKVKNYIYSMNIKAPFFNDVDKFLESTEMDAVFISVPPAFTWSIIEKCAKRNINFFVEKPLASSLEYAQKIVDVTDEKNLITSVGYMYSYKEIILKAKEIIDSNILGKVIAFEATAYITQVLSPKKGWRYQKSTAGGGCMSLHGTHLLYLLYFFFGLPNKILSRLFYPYSEVEDKAFAKLLYGSGIKGKIKVSWSEEGFPKLTNKIKIIGENGTLIINEEDLILNIDTKKGPYNDGQTVIARDELHFASFELGGEGYFTQDQDFIKSLFKQNPVKVNVEDAYNVQKLLQCIYDSFEQKKEITLK
jgi:predicted dehydrogenase/nucleoside-diphosphate-sugar epimerase